MGLVCSCANLSLDPGLKEVLPSRLLPANADVRCILDLKPTQAIVTIVICQQGIQVRPRRPQSREAGTAAADLHSRDAHQPDRPSTTAVPCRAKDPKPHSSELSARYGRIQFPMPDILMLALKHFQYLNVTTSNIIQSYLCISRGSHCCRRPSRCTLRRRGRSKQVCLHDHGMEDIRSNAINCF